ncbi:MAG: methyltransferase, TrmA family [Dehalococcoidia bacterium]|nr:methyltransferase, TrmA family [Dehalococcoidia bacterium]
MVVVTFRFAESDHHREKLAGHIPAPLPRGAAPLDKLRAGSWNPVGLLSTACYSGSKMHKSRQPKQTEPERFTATIEDIAALGEGMARRDGAPVFVPYTIPGEVVEVEVSSRGRRYLTADVTKIIQPSAHRVDAPCPYYRVCSGCQWQHIDYSHQLELKRRTVVDHLKRIGLFEKPPVAPTVGCADPWHYRNHARFTVREGQLGFVNKTTHGFVPIERCLIMDEGVNQILARLQGRCGETSQLSIRYGADTGSYLVQPTLKAPDVDVDSGQHSYQEELLGRRFQVSSPSFFQVNSRQAARLIELIWARLNLSGIETVVDAYAGVGTFASVLASHARRVIAIEESSAAVKDARVNLADLSNVELVLGKTEDVLATLSPTPDAVILDPPRTGCHVDALQALIGNRPPRVVYVSCDPATLARDLRVLSGAYELLEAQPVDMFPHTHHVEIVATLQRRR